MDTFCGIPVVTDDALFHRAAAEGHAFEDEADAYSWLAEVARDPGNWPRCGCDERCSACVDLRIVRSDAGRLAFQEIDHRTGVPRPPEWRRLRRAAVHFAIDHRHAQAWLPSLLDVPRRRRAAGDWTPLPLVEVQSFADLAAPAAVRA